MPWCAGGCGWGDGEKGDGGCTVEAGAGVDVMREKGSKVYE